jgi:hypothetical protein
MTRKSGDFQVRIASGINVVLGALIALSPWLLNYARQPAESAATELSVIIGLLIVVFAAFRVARTGSSYGWSGLNALLGLWTVLTPFIFDFRSDPRYVWSSIIVGAAVIVLAAWSGNVTLRAARSVPA